MSDDVRRPKELTDEVLSTLDGAQDPRFRELMAAVVRHLHEAMRETRPTEDEWMRAIEFLTAVGQACTPERQEFILLSDVLGVSSLVESLNHESQDNVTESTILGPFYRPGAAHLPLGAAIGRPEDGEPARVHGVVRSSDGRPLAGATVDVWQANVKGLYDVQDPTAPPNNLRGIFTTDSGGRYEFVGVRPTHYPVPTDGPVGDLLRASGRDALRSAHIHLLVNAEEHQPLVTHIFEAQDARVTRDAVFGVKDSLLRTFEREPDGTWRVEFDVVLQLKPSET